MRRSALAAAMAAACIFSGTAAPASGPYPARPHEDRILLADLVEGKDKIIYRTDPAVEEDFEEDQRHERRKEEKSWQMLQNMNIYKESGDKRKTPQSGSKTSQ